MTNNTTNLLQPPLFERASQAAQADGVSLSDFVGSAVEEKLAVRDFIVSRLGRSAETNVPDLLRKIGHDETPIPGDGIERGARRTAAE